MKEINNKGLAEINSTRKPECCKESLASLPQKASWEKSVSSTEGKNVVTIQ